jgi:YidC/Oxa1 family membrane protein insertase
MLTVTQSVTNAAPGAASVPFARINRTDKTMSQDTWQVHSGPIGAFDGSVNFSNNYTDVAKAGSIARQAPPTGSALPTSTGCRR